MIWSKHKKDSIKSAPGYVIERTTYQEGTPDTVFICFAPDGYSIGGTSGVGIDASAAKDMCERHAKKHPNGSKAHHPPPGGMPVHVKPRYQYPVNPDAKYIEVIA